MHCREKIYIPEGKNIGECERLKEKLEKQPARIEGQKKLEKPYIAA
jgi:hypothetical protein